jgi:hypothetical protein
MSRGENNKLFFNFFNFSFLKKKFKKKKMLSNRTTRSGDETVPDQHVKLLGWMWSNATSVVVVALLLYVVLGEGGLLRSLDRFWLGALSSVVVSSLCWGAVVQQLIRQQILLPLCGVLALLVNDATEQIGALSAQRAPLADQLRVCVGFFETAARMVLFAIQNTDEAPPSSQLLLRFYHDHTFRAAGSSGHSHQSASCPPKQDENLDGDDDAACPRSTPTDEKETVTVVDVTDVTSSSSTP